VQTKRKTNKEKREKFQASQNHPLKPNQNSKIRPDGHASVFNPIHHLALQVLIAVNSLSLHGEDFTSDDQT
jgi:hypothetical protein